MNTLIISIKNNVKIIKFNKPKKKNAIDYFMYIEAAKELDSVAANDDISIVVLTGTGDFYSSGNEMKGKEIDTELNLKAVENFIRALILFPKILVAVVNGPAIGIAATTLPFCDFAYASDKAYFYTPFTKLGMVAEACSTITFPHLMGDRLARKMLMLNYKMPATEALACGLISDIYKQEELEGKAWKNIKMLLEISQDSMVTTKKLLLRPFLQEFLETNHIEINEIKRLHKSKL